MKLANDNVERAESVLSEVREQLSAAQEVVTSSQARVAELENTVDDLQSKLDGKEKREETLLSQINRLGLLHFLFILIKFNVIIIYF